jgi:hypothetical protein
MAIAMRFLVQRRVARSIVSTEMWFRKADLVDVGKRLIVLARGRNGSEWLSQN